MVSFADICEQLQKEPHDFNGRPVIWAVKDEILCDYEDVAEIIGDFLEAMGFGDVNTGYYNPEEDKRNNEVDKFTGWYYVTA